MTRQACIRIIAALCGCLPLAAAFAQGAIKPVEALVVNSREPAGAGDRRFEYAGADSALPPRPRCVGRRSPDRSPDAGQSGSARGLSSGCEPPRRPTSRPRFPRAAAPGVPRARIRVRPRAGSRNRHRDVERWHAGSRTPAAGAHRLHRAVESVVHRGASLQLGDRRHR